MKASSSPAAGAPGCGRSPTPAPSSSCRSRTSRSSSTASRRSWRRGSREIGIVVGDTAARRSGRRRRRLRFGCEDHLHRAGRAARPRARGPDRRGLPRRASRSSCTSATTSSRTGSRSLVEEFEARAAATRRSCSRTCPNPRRSASPSSRTAGSSGWSRSRRSRRSDLALVGVYMFDPRSSRPSSASGRRARGELEITDAIQWLVDHGRTVHAARRRRLVEGHRARSRTCSRRTASSSTRSSATSRGASTSGVAPRGQGGDRQGRASRSSRLRGPVVIGEDARIGTASSGRTRRSATAAGSSAARSRTRSCSRARGSRSVRAAIADSLIGATPGPPSAATARRRAASWSATTPRSGSEVATRDGDGPQGAGRRRLRLHRVELHPPRPRAHGERPGRSSSTS